MAMSDSDAGYLSIGEVLGLLLEEFPDVTISKIRFLESQGLINPERTPSGYRKFYDEDVELLRVILSEQKQNYLPLRVIKDRLETGEIVDPTGEHARNGTAGHTRPLRNRPPLADFPLDDDQTPSSATERPVAPASVSGHPASGRQAAPRPEPPVEAVLADPTPPAAPPVTQLLPGVLLDRRELCGVARITDAELDQLEQFGVVASGHAGLYDDDTVTIARTAVEFLRAGVDARHLRGYRQAAEREASLYEQLVTPRYRQRNPQARADALRQLKRLDQLGGQLRAAMTRQALRHHFES